ncbi:hypothetical protein [Streptomyces olivaceoviridis]|uniref:hypothetical protein n=1 Tax=Streptomyces olivaceoviridis TaxID=1921 RepID=UPI003675BDF3
MIRTVSADDIAIQVLSNEGAQCGTCGDEPGDRRCEYCEKCRARYIAALRAVGWAPRSEIQEQLDQARRELDAMKRELASLTQAVAPHDLA